MVDTAIFSIFHRAPAPPAAPAPPPPEPVEAAADRPAPPIVEHPLLSSPAPVRQEAPHPEPSQPVEPDPAPQAEPEPLSPVVAEISPAVVEPVEAADDHPEIPIDTVVPVHREPIVEPAAAPESVQAEPHAVEPPPSYEEAVAEIAEIVQGPEPEPIHDVELLAQPAPAELEPEPELIAEPVPEAAPAPGALPHLEPEPKLIDEPVPEPVLEAAPAPVALPDLGHEPEPIYEPTPEPGLAAEPAPAATFVVEAPPIQESPPPLAAAFDHLTETETAYHAPEPQEPLEYVPVDPPAPHWADQLPPLPADIAAPQWHGPAQLARIPVDADQLGLANPIVITLVARLKDSSSVELDASQSGIYRPQTFRAAPWSGFAYDQAMDGRTGLAAGTRILTSRGEMEVERLLPGDTAMTLRAPALVPIAWIGKSVATAAPIWIDAGALGPNLPRRGLCLAPDQPVYVEPIPVPAARLVNGTTIRVVETEDVDLFHVDVGRSEILFAEGLPLSSGDRTRLQRA